jgi:N-acetylglucosamine malate deacetylase 1
MSKRILVIGAHPDDETMGVGGTIAKMVVDRFHTELCIVTSGYEPLITKKEFDLRRKEAMVASKILGFDKVHFLELPAVKLDTVPKTQINGSLADIIEKTKPDTIFTTSVTDINMDHRIVYEATMVAARPRPGISVKKLLSYELPSSTEWGELMLGTPFIPNTFVDITDTLDKKLDAMKAYRLEIKNYPHPRSLKNIESLARIRGTTVGFEAAEAFRLIYDRS